MEHLSKEISENQRIVEERLRGCDDILLRPIMLGKDRETACFLIYIETAVSNLMLEDSVIGRFLNGLRSMEQAELYETLEKDGMGLSDTGKLWDMEAAFAAMLAGNAVLFADGLDFALKIGSKGYPGNGVQKAESHKKTDSEYRAEGKRDAAGGEFSYDGGSPLYGGSGLSAIFKGY